MKEELLQRLLSLIEKTGDRLVITDSAGERPYVLMALDHYEKLVVGEWKPEALKREPAPPHTLPISTSFPDNKPPKREIPLWKPAHGPAPASQAPPSKPSGPQPGVRTSAPMVSAESKSLQTPQHSAPEPEGEEQFYLEPLE